MVLCVVLQSFAVTVLDDLHFETLVTSIGIAHAHQSQVALGHHQLQSNTVPQFLREDFSHAAH
eukprot:7436972-Prorocentrum_lima.AAC.1